MNFASTDRNESSTGWLVNSSEVLRPCARLLFTNPEHKTKCLLPILLSNDEEIIILIFVPSTSFCNSNICENPPNNIGLTIRNFKSELFINSLASFKLLKDSSAASGIEQL